MYINDLRKSTFKKKSNFRMYFVPGVHDMPEPEGFYWYIIVPIIIILYMYYVFVHERYYYKGLCKPNSY